MAKTPRAATLVALGCIGSAAVTSARSGYHNGPDHDTLVHAGTPQGSTTPF